MIKKSIRKIMLWTAAVTAILTQVGYCNSGEQITVRPVEINDMLHNPDVGWCLLTFGWNSVEDSTVNFTGGDNAPLFDVVVLDFMWANLEPENNVFDWKKMDAIIDYWTKREKQYSMRICMSYYTPLYSETKDFWWKTCSPPAWLFDELGCGYEEKKTTRKKITHTLKRPHYYDPIFLKQHEEFLKALAAHYDKPNNRSAFMEIRSYGKWGEWRGDSYFNWANVKQQHDTLAEIIRQYPRNLKHTPFCIPGYVKKNETYSSLDDYMYQMAYDVSESLGVMNRRDGFPRPFKSSLYMDQRLWKHWPRIPCIGELNNYSGFDPAEYQSLIDYHVNIAQPYVYNRKKYNKHTSDYRRFYEAGLKAGGLGYRFALTSATYNKQVSAGSILTLNQTWVNRNVGRAYRVYPLKVYFIDPDTGREIWSGVDGKFDQTPWIKGESYNVASEFSIPSNIPPGTYELRIAMVDGTGAPRIALAITGGDTKKRYRIGSVIVSN
ncbi:MAG: DUF4832 domain-containing protein [Sedimentisphaerales bacterium]|nr:DUF4832 domain-containing protein [Sedimentisphaerales bacterium]